MRIVVDDLSNAQVAALLAVHLSGMHDASPPESVHALGIEQLRDAAVTVWSAWEGDELMGIGALAQAPGSSQGEVKSMRTAAGHLGKGVGRAILRTIIDEARARGLTRLSLETGTADSFAASRHLYRSEGFEPCGPFGTYVDDPHSCYFTLALAGEPA